MNSAGTTNHSPAPGGNKPSSLGSSTLYNAWKLLLIFLMFLIYADISAQKRTDEKAYIRREAVKIPKVKFPVRDNAPGYCTSEGGSMTWEYIEKVNVVEKANGMLSITVDIYITNPYNCQAGEPCNTYDRNPENVHVWIDWDGNKAWEPSEMVMNEALQSYGIGFNTHRMTAMKEVDIPEGAKRPTWLRANLGWGANPEDPCQQYWTYGNVVDEPILWDVKIMEISAIGGIDIGDVPKPLLANSRDDKGNLFASQMNDPLAAAGAQATIELNVKLKAYPDDKMGANSKTVCNYKISSDGAEALSDKSEFTGKDGKLKIKLPQKIGKYDMELNFKFYGEQQNLVGKDLYTIPLWISYKKPVPYVIKKKIWLDKAITFTEGTLLNSDPEHSLAREMMIGIHDKGGEKWNYYYSNQPVLWSKLVEDQTNKADCRSTANIWLNLLKTLGVQSANLVEHKGDYGIGFLSIKGLTAYGGKESANGNAAPNDYTFTPTWDRWAFYSHTFGQLGIWYFDPVFSKYALEKFFHVYYSIRKSAHDTILTGSEANPGPLLWKTDTYFTEDNGNWEKYVYEYRTSPFAGKLHKALAADGAKFTGTFSEKEINTDGDTFTDQLSADVEVEITKAGVYYVSGALMQGDEIITKQPYNSSPGGWHETIGPSTGKITVHPTFSGESIYEKKLNGIYTFDLYITDTSGAVVASSKFNTKAHQYAEFSEIPLRISQISESPVDSTGDGLYDAINIKTNLQSSFAGSYSVQGIISKDSLIIASASRSFNIGTGSQQMMLKLETSAISALGKDGPYTISVQLCNGDGTQLSSGETETASYKASQFAPPEVRIITGTNDYAVDYDLNALFDTLQVELQLNSLVNNKYTITAYLASQKDSFIAAASSDISVTKGYSLVLLNFPGTAIGRSKTDGPYKISYAVIQDTMLNPVYTGFNLYTTDKYTSDQFEQPRGKVIQSTGVYSEKLIDADNNGLTDSLEIDVEVIPLEAGYIIAMGQLKSSDGERICWTSGRELLPANEKGNVKLKFDGRMIYGNLSDGPFDLKNLLIYHSGLPEETISIENAYKTSDYKYLNFEKACVVTGKVTDINGNPVAGALLSIQDTTFDYSEPTGKYHLVMFSDGTYPVKIKGPDTLKLDWNMVQDNTITIGDSLMVAVTKDKILTIDFKAPLAISAMENENTAIVLPYYELMQNYPNPFNPSTTIKYNIPEAGYVRLDIFDMLGKKIATLVDEYQSAGIHQKTLKAENLASGIYYYRIRSGSYLSTKKMLLVK
ncbi:MAG: T9SS type A sorting domain-containing protein [Syntrophomonadaceae bacterium]